MSVKPSSRVLSKNGKKNRGGRLKNLEIRCREHLLPDEVEALIKAARVGRHGDRNALMILMMFRHGFRVSEVIVLRWAQIDLKTGLLHVNRLKGGVASTHPISARESRALHSLKRNNSGNSPFVFVSHYGAPMQRRNVNTIIAKAGVLAEIDFPVHPHQLRHACGYYLALHGHDTRAIQAYLGHTNIEHTVRYTALAPDRFKNFWLD